MANGLTLGLSRIGDLLINNKITKTDSGNSITDVDLRMNT